MRLALALLALITPFWLPLPFAIAFIALAAFFAPFLALAAGLLIDLTYAPGGLGTATLIGVLGTIVALVMRRFTETRIMGG